MEKTVDISVIVPIFNEEHNIVQLDDEIKTVVSKITNSFEIVYIDDGSTDNSLTVLKKISGITIIRLNRNYGQTTALDVGFKTCVGKYVVSLDGDGQNDPADILPLLNKLKKDKLDVVAGWRKSRKDNYGINFLTKVGCFLRHLLINDFVHDSGCTLRVYTNEAIKTLDIQGEMHRYILSLLKCKGFKIGEMVVNHRPRANGKSKYNYSKAIRGFIDLLYIWFIQKYAQRPLHLFGYGSFLFFLIGAIFTFVSIYQKLFNDLSVNRSGYFFIGVFSLVTALVLFSFGIVIDLLIRIQFNSSLTEKRYYVREIIKN